jgi:hypothetical protein
MTSPASPQPEPTTRARTLPRPAASTPAPNTGPASAASASAASAATTPSTAATPAATTATAPARTAASPAVRTAASRSSRRAGARPRIRGQASRARVARPVIPTTVWTAPARRAAPGDGETAWSPVGRIMAAFPDRAPNAIVLTAAHAAAHAATRAAAHAHAAGSTPPPFVGWPGTTPQGLQHPADIASGPVWVGAERFWADMITPASDETTAPTSTSPGEPDGLSVHPSIGTTVSEVRDGGREAVLEPPPFGGARARRARRHRWDLVVVEMGCQPADDGIGLLGADLLAPGGILAVLTHSEQIEGRLLDPTGSVVTSAQAADLLYLQHIALLTTPLHPAPANTHTGDGPGGEGPPTLARPAATGGVGGDGRTPGGGLLDLLLFLQPGAPDQRTPLQDPTAPDPPAEPCRADARLGNGDRA